MNVLKNNIKLIILIIILIIISSGISVFATSTYFANQVNYTTSKNGEIKTVADALNDLYSNKTIGISNDIEEIALVSKWISNPNTCGSQRYNIGESVSVGNSENNKINFYWDSNDGNWYFKANQTGNYIVIYGTSNASITKQSYSANDNILTIGDSTIASTYGAIIVIKLK